MNSTGQLEHVQIDGCRLEYLWSCGAVEPYQTTLVLLHEGLGCVRSWSDFPQVLAASTGLAVLAYSRAGYGGSGPASLPRQPNYMHHEALVVLPALLEKLNVESPLLIGHSDGASIAIIYAGSNEKEILQGLVLMAPHVFHEQVSLAGVNRARLLYQHADLRDKLMRYHGNQVDDAFWGWNDVWRLPDFQDWNIENSLDNIDVPVLVIQGTDDEYGSVAQLDAIESRVLSDIERHFLENVGHSPQREQSAFVLDMINRLIGRL